MAKKNKQEHQISGLHPAPSGEPMIFDELFEEDHTLALAGYEKSSIDTLRIIRLYPSPSREVQFTRYVVNTQRIRIARQ